MPSRDDPLRVKFGFEGIEQIQICESVSFEPLDEIEEAWIHPKEFYITSEDSFERALKKLKMIRMKEKNGSNPKVRIWKHTE